MSEDNSNDNAVAEEPEAHEHAHEDDHEHDHDDEHDHDHEHEHEHDHEHEEEEFQFVEDPSFEVEYKGDCAYEVKVVVPVANEKKQADELFDELQDEAQLPGFRRGRAPRKLLEKKFAKAVRGDATEKLVSAAFRKFVKDQKLRPISSPTLNGLDKALDRSEDEPLSFTLSFEVSPRCELGAYRGIAIDRPVMKVTDREIDEAVESLRGRYALYEKVEDAEAQEGDQIVIDFTGIIDGEAFAGGSAKGYPYILGSKRFFPQFEDALKGVKAGTEVHCEVPFPEDYSSKVIAGKTAQFTIAVSEIKRKQLPEINDEFATMAGAESLAALRETFAKQLTERFEATSRRIAETNAMKAIVEASTFELPKTLVEASAKEYYEQEVRRLSELRVPQSDIRARDEEIRAEAEANAIREIKGFVALNEIGSAEGIEVTEADFEKEAESIIARTGAASEAVGRFLQDEAHRDEYEGRIYRRKAMDLILGNAQITDKEVTEDELDKENAEV